MIALPRLASPGPKGWFVDLFSGAGGFSLGLSSAGFHCFGAVERDRRCAETYALNFPTHVHAPLTRLGPERGDITRLTEREVRSAHEAAGRPEIDVLAGGPPCQGFSRVGRGKLDSLARRRGAFRHDPRNQLYRRYMDFLQWLRPKGFIFENVPGIMRVRGENFAEHVCRDAQERGYRVRCAVLNAAWYGVPQTRDRVIIIGIRDDLPFEPGFPEPQFSIGGRPANRNSAGLRTAPFSDPSLFVEIEADASLPCAVTVWEALADLPSIPKRARGTPKFAARALGGPVKYKGRPGCRSAFASRMRNWNDVGPATEVLDHFCRHNPRDYRIFAKMRPNDCYPRAVEIARELLAAARSRGSRRVDARAFVPPYSVIGFEEKWKMLDPKAPSWTVTAHLSKDCYSHIHYDARQARTISIREAARLQSFPDRFQFCGGMGDRFRQIGNAVPPLLALAIATKLREILRGAGSRFRSSADSALRHVRDDATSARKGRAVATGAT